MHLRAGETKQKTVYELDKAMQQLRAAGFAAEAITVLFAFAWALPLFFFSTFTSELAYYSDALSFLTETMWATLLAMASSVIIASHVFNDKYKKLGIFMRAMGCSGIAVYFGIIAWVGLFNNYEIPSPYIHFVMSLIAIAGGSTALINPPSIIDETEAFAIIVPNRDSS